MTASQPSDSGVVLIDGKVYPACVAGDPAAMAAIDERYDQLLADWEFPVGPALDRLRIAFGTTPAAPAQAA